MGIVGLFKVMIPDWENDKFPSEQINFIGKAELAK